MRACHVPQTLVKFQFSLTQSLLFGKSTVRKFPFEPRRGLGQSLFHRRPFHQKGNGFRKFAARLCLVHGLRQKAATQGCIVAG